MNHIPPIPVPVPFYSATSGRLNSVLKRARASSGLKTRRKGGRRLVDHSAQDDEYTVKRTRRTSETRMAQTVKKRTRTNEDVSVFPAVVLAVGDSLGPADVAGVADGSWRRTAEGRQKDW